MKDIRRLGPIKSEQVMYAEGEGISSDVQGEAALTKIIFVHGIY